MFPGGKDRNFYDLLRVQKFELISRAFINNVNPALLHQERIEVVDGRMKSFDTSNEVYRMGFKASSDKRSIRMLIKKVVNTVVCKGSHITQ